MGHRMDNVKAYMAEAFELADGETLCSFVEQLSEVVEAFMNPEGQWAIEAIGSGWCVALEMGYESGDVCVERHRLYWTREDEEVVITSSAPVKRRVVYDPNTSEDALEQVAKPTAAQRSDLPDSAYAAVFEIDGRTRKVLPHHVNTVKSADENSTVDEPRLRNALARFDQLRGVPDAEVAKARNHIEKHAKALGIGGRDEESLKICQLTKEHGPGTRFEFDGLRDTYLLEDVRVIEQQEGVVQEAAPFEVTDADFTSPTGQKYIAVMVGFGAMDSVINQNNRLYDPAGEEGQPGMEQNVADQQKMIAAAFKAGTASMGSELDHPSDGQTFQGLATELIDVKRDGVRVAIKEGVLDTSEGRNLKVAAAHGFPLGKSTLARGVGERRVMDNDNPFHALNPEKSGVYDHIIGFQIYQYDTVRHPSARVYAQLHGESVTPEVRNAFEALLCGDGTCPVNGVCGDGSEPLTITETDHAITDVVEQKNADSQENEMDETQVKQMIAEAVEKANEAANEANAELKATVDQLGEKQTATEAALTEAKEANAKLVDDLRDARAVADVAKEAIAKVTAERDSALLEKRLRDSAKAHCESLEDELEPIRVKREAYILDMADRFSLPELPEGAELHDAEKFADAAISDFVEACSKRFDKVVGPGMKELHEAANRRPIVAEHTDVRYQNGQGFSNDAIPIAFSAVPQKKETPTS